MHRLGDRWRERTRIADAGGATKTDEIESKGVESVLKPCLLQISRDDLRAWRQRCLNPRLASQALRSRVPRKKPRSYHDTRIRSVSAGGDRSNNDITVAYGVIGTLDRTPIVSVGCLTKFMISGR